jgi:hypothetical protein
MKSKDTKVHEGFGSGIKPASRIMRSRSPLRSDVRIDTDFAEHETNTLID